jgi:hypothetical protein
LGAGLRLRGRVLHGFKAAFFIDEPVENVIVAVIVHFGLNESVVPSVYPRVF